MQEPPQEPTATGPEGPEVPGTPSGPPARVRGRKRRFAKRWSRRFSLLAIALFAGLFVTFFTVDIGRIHLFGWDIRRAAEFGASKYLERPVHIGQVLSYVTPGHFEFRDFVIEGPTKDDRPFFQAKRMIVNVPWWTLFRRDVYLDINLYDWRMVVEKSADGTVKLPRLTRKNDPNKPPGQPWNAKRIDVYCHDGEFIYDDHQTPWSVRGPNLQFSIVRSLGTFYGSASFSKGLVKIQDFVPMHADFSTRFQLKGSQVDLKHIDLLTDGAESHISGYVDFGKWPDQEYRIQSTVDFNRMRELFFAKSDFRLSGQGRFNGIFKIFKDNPKKESFNLSGLFKSDEAGLGVKNTEWRLNDLDGELEWSSNHFVVKRADSSFLGGRMKMTYGLEPVGSGRGSTASLTADYSEVDAYLFTRQFGFTALEPQGRMRGHTTMVWHNGQFTETMQGQGATVITPPAGHSVAASELPAESKEIPRPAGQFVAYQPFGEFPIGGNTAYRFTWTTLDFDESWVATPSTYVKFSGHARGGDVHVPFHVTSHDWQTSDRLFSAIMTNFNHPVGAIPVGGRGTFDGTMTKAFNAPRIEGKFSGDQMWAWDQNWGTATGDIAIENSYLDIVSARIGSGEKGSITTSGRYSIGYRSDPGDEINATIHALGVPLDALKKAFGLKDWPVDGTLVAADVTLRGQYAKPGGSGRMRIEQGVAWGEPFDFATGDLTFGGDGSVTLKRVVVGKGKGNVSGSASLNWANDTFDLSATSDGLPVEELKTFRLEKAPLTGQLSFNARGYGTFDSPTWEIGNVHVPDLYVGDEGLGDFYASVRLSNRLLTLESLKIGSATSRLYVKDCHGTINLIDQYNSTLRCDFEQTSLDPYLKFVGSDLPFSRIIISGNASASGPLMDPKHLSVNVGVKTAELKLFDYDLANPIDQPIELSFHDNTFWLDRVNFEGKGTKLQFKGSVSDTARTVDIQASGTASLEVLHVFYPNLNSTGDAELQASFAGTFDAPILEGRADIKNGRIRPEGAPGLSQIIGRITMSNGQISVDGVRAMLGEGPVTFGGGIVLDGYRPARFALRATGDSMIMRGAYIPEGLQATVNAMLRFEGPVSAPTLHGEVNVLRANYTLRNRPEQGYFSLFSGLASDSNQTLGAVSEAAPSASPISLDITIRAPTMLLVDSQSINAQIYGSALITVTGTFDKPVVSGRVDIDRGSWNLNGNKISLLPGSIDFSNPDKLEPFFDLTAESRIYASGQTYHITVRLTGTMAKFTPSISSDPFLSEMQIVNLLMGDTSDAGAAELRSLNATQEEQAKAISAVGATILLSPVTASLGSAIQRVTTLNANVVPILGSESTLQTLNPTARIVLGRPISDRVYLTYSRTLSGTQNELILVEYEQNDKLSWVLSRNEDKTFALDFRVRFVVK